MQIICKYGENDVYYMITKYGPCIKFKLNKNDKKDTFIGIKQLPDENTVLELIDKFINKETIEDDNKIGKYTNNQIITYAKGKYGPYIKVNINKKDIFVGTKIKPSLEEAIKLIDNHLTKNKITVKMINNKPSSFGLNQNQEVRTQGLLPEINEDSDGNKKMIIKLKSNKKIVKTKKLFNKKENNNEDDLFVEDIWMNI